MEKKLLQLFIHEKICKHLRNRLFNPVAKIVNPHKVVLRITQFWGKQIDWNNQ